jgi:hypothetical protein
VTDTNKTPKLITVRLTYEEMRLLSDNFSASFIDDGADPELGKLSIISEKLSCAMSRARRNTP